MYRLSPRMTLCSFGPPLRDSRGFLAGFGGKRTPSVSWTESTKAHLQAAVGSPYRPDPSLGRVAMTSHDLPRPSVDAWPGSSSYGDGKAQSPYDEVQQRQRPAR